MANSAVTPQGASLHLPRWITIPLIVALTTSLGACRSESHESAKTRTVDIELTDAGCTPATVVIEAGPTTFRVTNDNSSKVTEFEVMSGANIEGEVENVTPGLRRTFSLNLRPGSYGLHCPGGTTNSDGVLTVSSTNTTIATDTTGAVANYKTYVQRQAEELVTRTKSFTDAVIADDVDRAKSLYAGSRAPYERIEPVVESFGGLDPAIDGRADDTPVEQITGFHRIENALWERSSTADMTPIAQKLARSP